MAILYFTCQCSKKLATDRKDVDLPIQCPDCQRHFKVPHPATSWNCPSCGSKMFATLTLVGKMVKCVQCGYESQVPAIRINTASISSAEPQPQKTVSHGKELFVIIAVAIGFLILISIPVAIFMQYRPLNQAMDKARKSSDPAKAVAILQDALSKHPNAPNAEEARALLSYYEEPIIQTMALSRAMSEADELASKNQLWEAVDKLKISVRSNSKASNLNEAKKKMEELQLKAEHTMELEKVFEETMQNITSYQIAISTLEKAIQTYFMAVNQKEIKEKIDEFKQIIAESDALQTAMTRARNYPSSQSALQDLKLAIKKYQKADCQKEARELYEKLTSNYKTAAAKASPSVNNSTSDIIASSNNHVEAESQIIQKETKAIETNKSSGSSDNKEGQKDLGNFLKTFSERTIEVEDK